MKILQQHRDHRGWLIGCGGGRSGFGDGHSYGSSDYTSFGLCDLDGDGTGNGARRWGNEEDGDGSGLEDSGHYGAGYGDVHGGGSGSGDNSGSEFGDSWEGWSGDGGAA